MTREEAIKILKAIRVYECYPKSASEETKEAIDMAIEALNSVTDSENGAVESKNDVIKRQDAIKTVIRMCSPICDGELEKQAYMDCVVAEINSLPSAEAIHKPDYSYEAGMVRRLKEALSAEAVEVVRCKDCKSWYEWEHGTGSCHRSENGYNWFGVDATDYCSFGERKGGDSE